MQFIWFQPHVFPYTALVFGLLVGSFYNVCVARYLSRESIVFPASKCPKCGHKLAPWENIPLVSYLILGGKCRSCRKPISLRYPALELLSGLWAMALGFKFGASAVWVAYMVWGALLLIMSFIDLDSFLLPDIMTLPGAAISLFLALFVLAPALGEPTRMGALIGMAVGPGALWLLQQGYRIIKKREGLGTGDVKLMLMLGAMLGWRALPVAITLGAVSALAGSLFFLLGPGRSGMRTMIPFGPFLSLGAMLYVLVGDYYWAFVLGRPF